VLDVRAVKSDHLRGQAWVVMSDVGDAVKAVREMDGFVMYGKELRVGFAKKESDVVVKARGGVVEKREKRKLPSTKEIKAQKVRQAATTSSHPQSSTSAILPYAIPPLPSAASSMFPPPPFPFPPSLLPLPPPIPNRILFVENLPPGISLSALSALFAPHAGHVESRLVPVRPGVAFVEWEDERRAGEAMAAMQGWKVEEGYEMRISYAKKWWRQKRQERGDEEQQEERMRGRDVKLSADGCVTSLAVVYNPEMIRSSCGARLENAKHQENQYQ
jgi:U2 small nuclear ribonucleoprotein B''